jgi:hypothetical protein
MTTRNPWDNPNAAYYLAVQAGVPSIAEGDTGAAKSQAGGLALARATNRKFVLLIGSSMSPEDFGGFPAPNYDAGYMELMPMHWAHLAKIGPAVVFMDEFTTTDPAKRAPALSIITERKVGDVMLHPDTLVAAACNPPEMCPNGSPLEQAMCNRFYHHDWVHPFEDWAAGVVAGFKWEDPAIPVLPDNWRTYCDKWGILITGFLRKNPKLRSKMPDDPMQKGFPTIRSWTNTAYALGAADSCGAPTTIQAQLLNGIIGDAAAGEFLTYVDALDLVDPEDVLNGKVKFAFDEDKFSQASCMPSALVASLSSNCTGDRFNNALECMCDIAEKCLEICIVHFRTVLGMCPKNHAIPAALSQRMFKIVNRLAV